MLAATFEDHELTARWMAHHLSELIVAAESDTSTTVEQRATIVTTILEIWAARRTAPGAVSGVVLDHVFVALDRLGDERPWHFSRLRGLDGLPTSEHEAPLVAIAVGLERLSRETATALLWRAINDGIAQDAPWIEAVGAVGEQLEHDLLSATRSVRHRLRLLAVEEDAPDTDQAGQNAGNAEVVARLERMSRVLSDLATAMEKDSGGP
ncbi:hypothetical protein [Aeromicrobium alkaliterrae]|uniref:Uncharacterized protein n=1 Tax=Aeromicrobium alkaliterrae TaxID=302168 RepID=A0ABN2KFA5_9ACTN